MDLDTGAVVAATIQPANAGDPATLTETLQETLENLGTVQGRPAAGEVLEAVAYKGYHSDATLTALDAITIR